MQRLVIPLIFLLMAGCSLDLGPSRLVSASGPIITFADAGCAFQPGLGDVFYVDVEADDPNGPFDVDFVVADLYDDLGGGFRVATIELVPTADPFFWTAEIPVAGTFIDCTYPGYTVDVVAYDRAGFSDLVQVIPLTYDTPRL